MPKKDDLGALYRRHLQLMLEVRTYHGKCDPPSNFVQGIIGYFERNGRLTFKQENAILGWLEKEKNKLRFSGQELLEVPLAPSLRNNRFAQIMPRRKGV